MLSENIRLLRVKMGLSQQELANRLHVVRQTVSKWESSLSVPDADMLIRLGEELGASVSELLGEEKREKPDGIAELAEKLEKLNRRFADMLEGRRKRRRFAFLLLGMIGLFVLVPGVIFAIRLGRGAASVAVIGGADGPTSVFVSGAKMVAWPLVLSGAAVAVSGLGVFLNRKKR